MNTKHTPGIKGAIPKHLTDIVRAKYCKLPGSSRPYNIVEGKWEEFKIYEGDDLLGFVERTRTGIKISRKVFGLDLTITIKFSEIRIF